MVTLLRYVWNPEGVIAWFHRERTELDGHAPIDVAGDPDSSDCCCGSQDRGGRSLAREKRPAVVEVDAITHRYSSYDTPFWPRENTQPGRWHAHGAGATQYL